MDVQTRGYFESTPEIKNGVTIPNWLFALVGVSLVLGGIIWFFTDAPWLAVKNIKVEGEATEETKAEIAKLKGQNILWLSVTKPESAITRNQPSIRTIQILRGIPDTLRVKLIERQPALIWQVGETWYTLDSSGFVFRESQITKKDDGTLDYPGTDLPVIVDTKSLPVKIGSTVARTQFVTFVGKVKDHLAENGGLKYVRGEIEETTFSITVITDKGWKVLFDTTRPVDVQLRTLAKTLESKQSEIHEYIDVRVRGWVYYK